MRAVPFILLLIVLSGCRAKRNVTRDTFARATEIKAMGSRTLDGLLSSETDLHTMKVEFYHPQDSGSMGQGPVKSIEITRESGRTTATVQVSDSTRVTMKDEEEKEQVDKATEARQDNGTVIGVAIVLAVAALAYLSLRQLFK